MDVLYYSINCPHCKIILQHIVKNGLAEKLNCISVDKRTTNPMTKQTILQLANGQQVMLPPTIHSVPAMLLVKDGYRAIFGQDVLNHLGGGGGQSSSSLQQKQAVGNLEPAGMSLSALGSGNVVSEQFTSYDMSPHELSSKGMGGKRDLHGYVSAETEMFVIPTPDETWRPDKVPEGTTIEDIERRRNMEIPAISKMQNPFGI